MNLDRMISCVRREISYRKRLYPRWVLAGKISQSEADYEIETMEHVSALLSEIRMGELSSQQPLLPNFGGGAPSAGSGQESGQ